MKSKFYLSLLSIFSVLVFQNCQENSIEKLVPPEELIARISVAEEEKLLKGLDYLQAKTPVGARVNQSKIDKLRLDSVIRRIDPKTGSTNYSFFVEESRPYSLTNLVITENKGAYLAFFVEYISANPKAGWNLVQFQGMVKLTSIDGKVSKIATITPSATSGRTDGWSCSNSVTQITKSWSGGSSSYFETEYACSFIESNDFGDISDSGNNVTPGMTGINDNGVSPEPEFVVGNPDPFAIPIPDIKQHMKCFDLTKPAKFTIFVDQPVHNGSQYVSNKGVGHSFFGIEQNGIIRTVGFYPMKIATPLDPSDLSQLKDNAGKPWDVSVSFGISADELNGLLNYINNQTPAIYHLNNFNCTNWVISASSSMNINLPSNGDNWAIGSGLNPGRFGQDIRNFTLPDRPVIISSVGQVGSASVNAGSCQ